MRKGARGRKEKGGREEKREGEEREREEDTRHTNPSLLLSPLATVYPYLHV